VGDAHNIRINREAFSFACIIANPSLLKAEEWKISAPITVTLFAG
jgi:hypothetical protein